MNMRMLSAAWAVCCVASTFAQTPSKPPVATAKITGRIVAADTGRPLRRVAVTLMAMPSKATRVTETDRNGRYEFSGLLAGRYSVRPNKDGYVVISPDPFSVGLAVDLSEAQVAG